MGGWTDGWVHFHNNSFSYRYLFIFIYNLEGCFKIKILQICRQADVRPVDDTGD